MPPFVRLARHDRRPFTAILLAFGDYCATRGCEHDTWGMFTAIGLTHISSGRIGLSLQFCNPDGRCDDLKPLDEFLDRFAEFSPARRAGMPGDQRFSPRSPAARQQTEKYDIDRLMWPMQRSATVEAGTVAALRTSPVT